MTESQAAIEAYKKKEDPVCRDRYTMITVMSKWDITGTNAYPNPGSKDEFLQREILLDVEAFPFHEKTLDEQVNY